jgi:DNA oxidative demethylase
MQADQAPRSMDLFAQDDDTALDHPDRLVNELLAPGAWLLRAQATGSAQRLWRDLQRVLAQAPLRHMVTPGGFQMSVAMSNCGSLGWISDGSGYRYSSCDPVSARPWPALPDSFRTLARQAASLAGFTEFDPDACLINCYQPGARLSLHQDRDEYDLSHPIVSVSLGLPATFVFGGIRRSDRAVRVPLAHGDVVVWGGAARLRYHGVLALKAGQHPMTAACRFNLTLRKAA